MDAKQIETIATECADEAASQAGHPFDEGGSCTLPTEPMPGDSGYLADQIGREPTDEEAGIFADAYTDRMEYHRDGWDRSRRLKAVRDALEMDQAPFAKWMGVSSQQRVSEWERGVRYPAIEKVQIAEMKVENPELWAGEPPSPAEARRLWTDRNNDGEGYTVGDDDDHVNELADELGELVRPAGTDDDVAVYRTASDRFVGVADANGPWAVDLS